MLFNRLRGAAFVATLLACAPVSLDAQQGAAVEPSRIVSVQELIATNQTTVLEAIRVVRPEWLVRAQGVYLDNTQIGDTSTLATIKVDGVVFATLIPRRDMNAGRRSALVPMIQVVTQQSATEYGPVAVPHVSAPPTWGLRPQLSLFGGMTGSGGRSILHGYFEGKSSFGGTATVPFSPEFGVRALVARDHFQGRDKLDAATNILSAELALKGTMNRSPRVHPYALLGVGYYAIDGTNGFSSTHALGLNVAGGVEAKLGGPISSFVEASSWLGGAPDQRAYVVHGLRVGLSFEAPR
jgi:hypothetical protein